MSARVDVIIPTFNGWEFLSGCLEALQRQSFRDFQIIVVDDASTDGTTEHLRDSWPNVRVIPLRFNVGLARAIDLAFEISSAELVALLNNDTEPANDWLQRLVETIDRHPDAAAVTSKLLLFDRHDYLHSAGDTYSLRGRPGNRGVWQRDVGQFDVEEEVFGACAGAALYRRKILDEAAAIDGSILDPDFFMYCEDVDLSWRLHLLGYSIVYAPRAIVHHRLSATGGGPLASYFVARNTILVVVKDLPGPLLRRNVWRIINDQVREVWQTLPHVREPAARSQLRGTLAATLLLPRMLRKRRQVQGNRRISIERLEQLLEP